MSCYKNSLIRQNAIAHKLQSHTADARRPKSGQQFALNRDQAKQPVPGKKKIRVLNNQSHNEIKKGKRPKRQKGRARKPARGFNRAYC